MNAVDAKTGKLIWQTGSLGPGFGAAGQFYSTPAVAFGRVYAGNNDDRVYSFDIADGDPRLDLLDRRLRLLGPDRGQHPAQPADRLHRLLRRQHLRARRQGRRASAGAARPAARWSARSRRSANIVYVAEFTNKHDHRLHDAAAAAGSSTTRRAPTRRSSPTAARIYLTGYSSITALEPVRPKQQRARVSTEAGPATADQRPSLQGTCRGTRTGRGEARKPGQGEVVGDRLRFDPVEGAGQEAERRWRAAPRGADQVDLAQRRRRVADREAGAEVVAQRLARRVTTGHHRGPRAAAARPRAAALRRSSRCSRGRRSISRVKTSEQRQKASASGDARPARHAGPRSRRRAAIGQRHESRQQVAAVEIVGPETPPAGAAAATAPPPTIAATPAPLPLLPVAAPEQQRQCGEREGRPGSPSGIGPGWRAPCSSPLSEPTSLAPARSRRCASGCCPIQPAWSCSACRRAIGDQQRRARRRSRQQPATSAPDLARAAAAARRPRRRRRSRRSSGSRSASAEKTAHQTRSRRAAPRRARAKKRKESAVRRKTSA